MRNLIKELFYHFRKLFIWSFEANILHYVVNEAEKIIDKKIKGTFTKDYYKKIGVNLIKKVASQPFDKCSNACKIVTNSSCNGLLDNIKLDFNPSKGEVKFNVDGSDLLKFDLMKKIFK